MKIVIRDEVVEDLESIFAWISRDNPSAAGRVVMSLRQRLNLLLTPGMARMGRTGTDEGTLELVEAPYIIVYEVHDDREEIEILAIVYGAQDR